MARTLLVVVATMSLMMLALISHVDAQPYYTYINTTQVYNATTDGSSNNGFFFDVPRALLSSSLSIQASTAYDGKNLGAFMVRFFLRRWAPAGVDYDSATSLCGAATAVNASLNPNDCYYTDLLPQSNGLVLLPNVSLSLPRAGRYYLSVFTPSGAVQKNTLVSYSVQVSSTQCPDGLGGSACTTPVMGLTFDGSIATSPNGTVAPGEWAYFSFELTDITTSELIVSFFNTLPGEVLTDGTGFYMRYGNIPFLNPLTADVLRLYTDSVANWINPWVGTYVIGFYGGTNGTTYSFTVQKSICPLSTAGAWCDGDRRPRSDPSCLTGNVKDCGSDYTLMGESNVPYNMMVPAETWTYASFSVASSQYSVMIVANASSDGASTLVLSPDAIPENNAEVSALFPLTSVYPVVGPTSFKASFFTYNYALAGTQLVVGVLGGAKDSNITLSVSISTCPGNCNGQPGACDSVSNRCYCPASDQKVDVNTCTPIESSGGLSNGAIVAISILVPLGVLVLIGGALFALYWFKFRQPAYDTI